MMKDPRFLPCLLAAIAAVMSSGCGATQPARRTVGDYPDYAQTGLNRQEIGAICALARRIKHR